MHKINNGSYNYGENNKTNQEKNISSQHFNTENKAGSLTAALLAALLVGTPNYSLAASNISDECRKSLIDSSAISKGGNTSSGKMEGYGVHESMPKNSDEIKGFVQEKWGSQPVGTTKYIDAVSLDKNVVNNFINYIAESVSNACSKEGIKFDRTQISRIAVSGLINRTMADMRVPIAMVMDHAKVLSPTSKVRKMKGFVPQSGFTAAMRQVKQNMQSVYRAIMRRR